jgi:hypothetical protein
MVEKGFYIFVCRFTFDLSREMNTDGPLAT